MRYALHIKSGVIQETNRNNLRMPGRCEKKNNCVAKPLAIKRVHKREQNKQKWVFFIPSSQSGCAAMNTSHFSCKCEPLLVQRQLLPSGYAARRAKLLNRLHNPLSEVRARERGGAAGLRHHRLSARYELSSGRAQSGTSLFKCTVSSSGAGELLATLFEQHRADIWVNEEIAISFVINASLGYCTAASPCAQFATQVDHSESG
jgi:hypothetical protein